MSDGDHRLERLTGLARVWGRLYFYHPALTVPNERWEHLLVAAIPIAEAATPAAYAAALNESLIRHLEDPWTYAAVADDDPSTGTGNGTDGRPKAELPSGGAGYLDASDVTCYEDPNYLTHLGDALGRLAESAGVILDLRWRRPPEMAPWPGAFGLFLREPLRLPGAVERLHNGWCELPESVYQETWLTRPGWVLQPLQAFNPFLSFRYPGTDFAALPRYDGPLVVLVSDAAVGWLDDALIGLQTAGRALVVHETAGAVRLPQKSLRLWGDVEIHARLYRLAGASGWVEPRPDRITPAGSGRWTIAAAEELLRRGSPSTPSALALGVAERPLPRALSPSMEPLPRDVRLLGLIKLWVVLDEFFPHLGFADLDWPNLIRDWAPRVEAVQDTRGYYGVLRELAARLNDSHVGINHPAIREMTGTHVPPVSFRRIEGSVVVEAVEDGAAASGLERGMLLTHVDGRPAEEVIAERGQLVSSSTPGRRDLVALMAVAAGAEGSSVRLTVEGRDGRRDVTAKRSVSRMTALPPEVDGERVRQVAGFGYIDLTRVTTSREFDDALRSFLDLPGLVLDMRGYPRFPIQQQVISRLIDRPVSGPRFHKRLRSAFERRSWHVSSYEIEPRDGPRFAGPVAVLIDSRAISAAEDFCMYLRNAGRVTFVGSPTAGTDGNVTLLYLPGGGSLSFTGMRVLHGDGSRFQNIGILPDVPAEPTIAGFREGRDEVLEAGIAALRRG